MNYGFLKTFHFETISTSQKSYKKYIKNPYTCYQFVTFYHICFPPTLSLSLSLPLSLSVCLSQSL